MNWNRKVDASAREGVVYGSWEVRRYGSFFCFAKTGRCKEWSVGHRTRTRTQTIDGDFKSMKKNRSNWKYGPAENQGTGWQEFSKVIIK